MAQSIAAGSPSEDADTPAACWSKPLGSPRVCQVRCAPSSCESEPPARSARGRCCHRPQARGPDLAHAAPERRLRLGASRPARRKLRGLELSAGHPPPRGQRGAAYTYNLRASGAGAAMGRAVRDGLPAASPAGPRMDPRYARAPQARCAIKAARQGSHLSPALRHAVTRAPGENGSAEESSCRSHQLSSGVEALSGCV